MKFKIDKTVFETFPDMVEVVPVITGFNASNNKDKALEMLRTAEKNVLDRLKAETWREEDDFKKYVDTFTKFGAPSVWLPSHAALTARVTEGEQIPDINPVVNFYNSYSLENSVPFGGENLSAVVGDMELTMATGGEVWWGMGEKKNKPALSGELIWKDGQSITCRAWNWRQGERTKLTEETKNGYFIMDGFGSNRAKLVEVANKFVNEFCAMFGGKAIMLVLDKDNLEGEIEFESRTEILPEEVLKPVVKVEKKIATEETETVKRLKSWLSKVISTEINISIEHPADNQFGDYTTNVAMLLARQLKESPIKIAQEIKNKLEGEVDKDMVEKIEVAGGGYINMYLCTDYLMTEIDKINTGEAVKNLRTFRAGKKYLVEHTSPEPTKTLHIGHFRNNFLGISIHNILESLGAEVTLDCIDNDRGMKICKTMWGYLMLAEKARTEELGLTDYVAKLSSYKISDEELEKLGKGFDWRLKLNEWCDNPSGWLTPGDVGLTSDKFDNVLYSPAHRASELLPTGGENVQAMLIAWESEDEKVRKLWRQIIDWSTKGYERTYKRIGSFHDRVWHESEFYKLGKDWIKEGLEKGVFKKLPDGGVLTNLESYGLTDTIVMKRDGTSMYMTQDLQLTYQKVNTYPSDLYMWDIGNDQKLYLQQMYTVCEQLGIVDKSKLFHLNYGFITLKDKGKMGSRFGGVINGDDLLDELKGKIKQVILTGESQNNVDIGEVSEKVALAACKFGFLKISREKDSVFDPDESISIEGSSGSYLLYTYARCQSVSQKSTVTDKKDGVFNSEEMNLTRELYKYEEKVVEAAGRYNPSIIAEYLISVARKYNEFYGKYRIIGQPEEGQRVWLTKTTAKTLKLGLGLLGIETVEKM